MTRMSRSAAAEHRASVFKALGEPTRLRIVDYLRSRTRDATGTEIAAHVGISLALLCHHTDELVECGLLTKRKEGQTSLWHLNGDRLAATVAHFVD